MQIVNVIPYPKHEKDCCDPYSWLTWPGPDEHPKGPEYSGLYMREKLFGIPHNIQNEVAHFAFFPTRPPLAGGFSVRNINGEFIGFFNNILKDEMITIFEEM